MKITLDDGAAACVELTRRNLEVLLAKLDDSASQRTIGQRIGAKWYWVKAVENEEHYADRAPGEMYMPSSGVTL